MDYQRLTEMWMNIEWAELARDYLPLLIVVAVFTKTMWKAGAATVKWIRMQFRIRVAAIAHWRHERWKASATRKLQKIFDRTRSRGRYADHTGEETEYRRAVRLEPGESHCVDEGTKHVILKLSVFSGGYAKADIEELKSGPLIVNNNDFPIILEYMYMLRSKPEPEQRVKGHTITGASIDECASKPKYDFYSRGEMDALLALRPQPETELKIKTESGEQLWPKVTRNEEVAIKGEFPLTHYGPEDGDALLASMASAQRLPEGMKITHVRGNANTASAHPRALKPIDTSGPLEGRLHSIEYDWGHCYCTMEIRLISGAGGTCFVQRETSASDEVKPGDIISFGHEEVVEWQPLNGGGST